MTLTLLWIYSVGQIKEVRGCSCAAQAQATWDKPLTLFICPTEYCDQASKLIKKIRIVPLIWVLNYVLKLSLLPLLTWLVAPSRGLKLLHVETVRSSAVVFAKVLRADYREQTGGRRLRLCCRGRRHEDDTWAQFSPGWADDGNLVRHYNLLLRTDKFHCP